MPIRPFLTGQPFEPETINSMSRALQGVCEELRLRVAQKIIEYAQRGVRDADTLRAMVLKDFNEPPVSD